MGLSRRFLNLIVDNRIPGIKSLCSMDLEHLFSSPTRHPQTPDTAIQTPAADSGNMKNEAAAASSSESIQISAPTLTFRALSDQWKVDCFPLAESTVMCADQLGRTLCVDAELRLGGTMPSLHKPKRMPISILVSKPDLDRRYDHHASGTSLFIMERIPELEVGCNEKYSYQFEAFVCRKPTLTSYSKTWQCELLPPPPFVRDPKYLHSRPEISSYAVVDGGSQICISVDDVGTYCLDTEDHTWSQVGEWMLPFRGKVEYVPELKLWLGLSAKDRHLAAADLSSISTMNSQPQLIDLGKELYPPEEWKECKDSQIVNLGSGMFCITRFFSMTFNGNFGDESIDQEFTVFTGVEVVLDADSSGNGKVELHMIPHKSRRHMSNDTTINTVF
ncbi:hypothetical protein EJB05_11267, partial [Eragrostis curvula]